MKTLQSKYWNSYPWNSSSFYRIAEPSIYSLSTQLKINFKLESFNTRCVFLAFLSQKKLISKNLSSEEHQLWIHLPYDTNMSFFSLLKNSLKILRFTIFVSSLILPSRRINLRVQKVVHLFCFIQLNRQNTDWIVVKSCSSLTFCVCITKGSSSFDNWIGLIVLQFKRLIDKTMGTKSKLDFMGCFAMAFFFLVGRLSLF